MFVHDPLYRMSTAATTAKHHKLRQSRGATPGGASAQQDSSALLEAPELPAGLGNVDAERTLMRVKQQLEGREPGAGFAAVCQLNCGLHKGPEVCRPSVDSLGAACGWRSGAGTAARAQCTSADSRW